MSDQTINQISFPIDLKKSCVKEPTCFFQKMRDQTNLWRQESQKKNQKVFSTFFLLINSSKIGV